MNGELKISRRGFLGAAGIAASHSVRAFAQETRGAGTIEFLLDERGCEHNCAEHKGFDPTKPYVAPPGEEVDERQAALLKRLRTRNGRMQDHKPLVEQSEAIGHAVRAGYIYSAMADIARFSEAPEYGQAVEKIWQDDR